MESEKGNGITSTPDLLKMFDSLPDLKILAEHEVKGTDELVTSRQAKLKADYMQRKVPFVTSELMRHKSPCLECNKEFPAVEYLFFKDGSLLQLAGIDGVRLHRIREHGEKFPEDIKRFLLNVHHGVSEDRVERPASTITRAVTTVERVDRSNVCPFLVRVFIKHNQGFKEDEFLIRGKEPGDEKNLHLWKDMTLRDVTELLKEYDVAIRTWGTRVKYSFVYPDKRGRNVMKEVGSVDSQREGRDDRKTLDALHFQIGDFVAAEVMERKPREENQTATATDIKTDIKMDTE